MFCLPFCQEFIYFVVSTRLASSPYHSIVDLCFLIPVSLSYHLQHIPFSVYITWSGSHRDNGTRLGEQMLCVAATWRAYITSTRAHSSSTAMGCFPASVAVLKNNVYCCCVVLSVNHSVRVLRIFTDAEFFFPVKVPCSKSFNPAMFFRQFLCPKKVHW